ncbi:hypothetical protein [Larkinella ripae]
MVNFVIVQTGSCGHTKNTAPPETGPTLFFESPQNPGEASYWRFGFGFPQATTSGRRRTNSENRPFDLSNAIVCRLNNPAVGSHNRAVVSAVPVVVLKQSNNS